MDLATNSQQPKSCTFALFGTRKIIENFNISKLEKFGGWIPYIKKFKLYIYIEQKKNIIFDLYNIL